MLSLQNQRSWLGRAQWALAASMALLIGVFYFAAYRPGTKHLASLRDQIARHQREIAAGQGQTSMLASVRSDVDRLKSKLKEHKVITARQDLGQVFKEIGALQQQASLKKLGSEMDPEVRNDRLVEIPIRFTFEGDFVSIYSFLRHAEELQRLTRVPKIKISGKDRQGLVKVQMTMSIYCAVE